MNKHDNISLPVDLVAPRAAAPMTEEVNEVTSSYEPGESRRDVLICRLVDSEATPAEWREFQALAANDQGAWRELAESQRMHALLCAEVGQRVGRAVHASRLDVEGAEHLSAGEHDTSRHVRAWGAWSGWAMAAAALTLVVVIDQRPGAAPIPEPPVNMAGLMRISSEQDAVDAYLAMGKESGRVIGEVPNRVIVDSEPCDTGDCYKVVFLRQFLETAEVCDLHRFATDEAGTPSLVPVADPGQPSGPY